MIVLLIAADNPFEARAYKEVFLFQAQKLALKSMVAWVQDLADGFGL